MKQKKPRGIALGLILGATFVLVLMTGAFVAVNASNFSLLASTISQEEATSVCESAYHYAIYKLEGDKSWGTAGFGTAPDPVVASYMSVSGLLPPEPSNRLQGTFTDGRGFSMDVSNNLIGVAISSEGVPPGCARLRIQARAISGLTRRLEAVLHSAPLYDASVISNGDMDISVQAGGKWRTRSVDPFRNQVRSNSNIKGPDAVSSDKLALDPTSGGTKGQLWAAGEITSGGKALSTSPADLAAAQSSSKGMISPKASHTYPINKLTADDIMVPSVHVSVPAGQWIFSSLDTSSGQKIPVLRHGNDIFFSSTDLGGDSFAPPYDASTYNPQPQAGRGFPLPNTEYFDGSGQKHQAVYINVDKQVWAQDNKTRVNTDGNFHLSCDIPGQHVTVGMGYDQGGILDALLPGDRGSMFADNGSLIIDGPVYGSGILVADGDVRLAAGDVLSSDKEVGVAIFAGHDVVFNSYGLGDYIFQGLVYAENDILTNSCAGKNVILQGAMVAHTGRINIVDAKDVVMTYDPTFLNKILKGLPSNNIKLERVHWALY